MKTLLLIFACAVCMLLPSLLLAQQQCQYLLDYWGYTWEVTPGGPYEPGKNGNQLFSVGEIDQIRPPLTYDMILNEYTYYLYDLIQNGDSQLVGSGSDPFLGPYVIYRTVFHPDGKYEVWEDPSKNRNYAPNPPNGSVPSTFIDGQLYLSGRVYNLVSYLTHYMNTGEEQGSFQGSLDFTGGSHLPELGGAATGWTFGGLTRNNYIGIPQGYRHRLDGQAFFCWVTSESKSWGNLKALYK